uniref:Protein transport protein Sec24-like At3g07100 n=1 Tax=Kalanchoe fedtschenkoi TaxID=63787 RepID=A0A7N0TY92_KALFE
MGTENPGRPGFPARPVPTPPQTTPFLSSGPLAGSEASAFRPVAPPVTSTPFSSQPPINGPQNAGFRAPPPPRTNAPSPYAPTAGVPFQRFPSPPVTSTAQATPRPANFGQPTFTPQPPLAGQGPPLPYSLQAQPPTVPMGSPPQTVNYPSSGGNVPPIMLGQPAQPSMPGYAAPSSAGQQPTSVRSPYLSQPGSYGQPQSRPSFPVNKVGYGPPPPLSAPYGMQPREHLQPPISGPPTGSIQGLVEDFNSLSLGTIPGSMDPGLDPKALPRPLEGDVEPHAFAESYPMNCHSRYLRLTTSAIPSSQSLAARWHLPLGAVVSPLAEAPEGEDVSIVNFSPGGIIRCRRCRTYVNPYVTFTDGGRKWRCNICALLNDVPGEYFAHLDPSGRRVDLDDRPELTKGSVELVAPTEYMVRPPMPPLYFFLIDVSVSAVRSGMLETVAQTIRSCLDELPGFPRTQIGFITFDSTLHFYNMKSSLTQPQMLVVSDLDDIFVPLPDDLLVNLSESRSVVETFLDSLPSMFQDNMNVESAFGPAFRAAFMIMSQLGGKLLIFQNMLPSLGVGRLKLRGDDLRVYGTDKEHALRTAEDPFYKQMAADFTKYQIAVDIFAFSDKYTDIASLGTLAKYTGGQVYYYPSFQSSIHGEKLRHELSRDLTRETAWEAVMRVRCGKGVRFTSYHGNFMLRSTDLLALPAVDCDKAYAMQLSLEETLLTTQTVYFQVALLYTSSSGERRIRVHTAAVPVVTDLGEMYRQADTGAIVSLFARLAIEKTLSHKLEDARTALQTRLIKALKEYRNLYAVQHRLGGRLIYPDSLKFLPLYCLALSKSTPLRGGYADSQLDERCAAGSTMMTLPVKRLLKLLYPNLIRIDEYLVKGSQDKDLKASLRNMPLTMDSLDSRGLYVYDDGFRFVIWFGRTLLPDIAKNILGPEFAADLSRVTLVDQDNEMSRKLIRLLKTWRENDPSYYQLCHLVRQGEQPREGYFLLANLLEDQVGGTNGYVDWILQLHRQVQQNP